ncbi:hypothetical protein H2198_000377 [Neophaeococcomyces mojaviensis]|uniref:Uncharacterized protein n=1 Tax=Neophaeococcomyces mojaviensis TaxID=3383035 RepID=A0ACC3AJW4_9EURO|nr:hypothetical protein H2198_000377 [Knufia sp. JES_112]
MDRLISWLGDKFTFSPTGPGTSSMEHKKSRADLEPLILNPRALSDLPTNFFPEPKRGICSWQTLFSSSRTNTDSLTVGIASCPPKAGYLAYHRHAQAEIYHVISGNGIVRINGIEYNIEKGSVVFIPGDAEHGVRNLNETEELKWLYCFAADSFEDVHYRFSEE